MVTDTLQAALGPSPSLMADINDAKSKFQYSLANKGQVERGKTQSYPRASQVLFPIITDAIFFSIDLLFC